ncbi:MAG TPA: hypothetical protein VJU87_00895 [Gemmatimonadaceae bacterium]|nr:hypothetical protein [Gemmatimonadaceae bacterium]
MWSDIFYGAEQRHLLLVLLWGALSVLAGTVLLVVTARTRSSPLLGRFARQCVLWGFVELAVAAAAYHALALRDVASATRAERIAWLALGLYLGIAGAGVAFAVATWRLAASLAASAVRALPAMGAGIGVALQGLALAVLELLFVGQISR